VEAEVDSAVVVEVVDEAVTSRGTSDPQQRFKVGQRAVR
jgi:hypothetical protein